MINKEGFEEYCRKKVLKNDIEANRFAMELLMPGPIVKREYEKIRGNHDDIEVAEELAKIFKVSPALMGIKMKELKLGFYGNI